jgi:uncharacterized membrane-anchored protein
VSAARLDAVLRAAVSEGVLPEQTSAIEQDTRPWPIVVLTGLGAWLAAIPLIGVVALLTFDSMRHGVGVYIGGLLVLAGAVAVLRSKTIPLFVEQLAVPGIVVGCGTIAFGLFRDLGVQGGAAALAVLALVVAALIPRAWLRVLLGAAAAAMLGLALVPKDWFGWRAGLYVDFWWAWHAVAALTGIAALARVRLAASGTGARAAAAIESMLAGSLLCVLAALAWWSGMAFLVGATVNIHDDSGIDRVNASDLHLLQAASALLAAAAAAWLARRWPTVRQPWCAGVAAVMVAIAWFMPALGAVLLALALCAASGRWRLASAAAVAATWIVSSFYYGLTWPLGTKALVLVGAGAILGALAWFASHRRAGESSASVVALQAAPRHTRTGVALTLLAVLAVANAGIWQKEQLVRSGSSIFVELAPRDPRSLMQGDYMSLNFRMPREVQDALAHMEPSAEPRVIARRDAQGIATLLRLDDGQPLANDELRMDLTSKGGRWMLASDAWFFKEGEAQRWAGARYGEFKVDAQGRVLLVGLRGAKLEAL